MSPEQMGKLATLLKQLKPTEIHHRTFRDCGYEISHIAKANIKTNIVIYPDDMRDSEYKIIEACSNVIFISSSTRISKTSNFNNFIASAKNNRKNITILQPDGVCI